MENNDNSEQLVEAFKDELGEAIQALIKEDENDPLVPGLKHVLVMLLVASRKPEKPDVEEKPDFYGIGSEYSSSLNINDAQLRSYATRDYIEGCNKIWNDYVIPLKSELSEARQIEGENQWISVDDKMPEPFAVVMVSGGIGLYTGAHWNSLTCIEWPGLPIAWTVTHWMPIPKVKIETQQK